jgi:hypothetical protein
MHQEVVVILDRSGSMETIADDAIGGFNGFLAEQQNMDEEALFSLVLFDNEYGAAFTSTPIQSVPPLDAATYVPRGSTALLDAVGRTLVELKARIAARPVDDRPQEVVVAILTDGWENASREFSYSQIRKIVEQRKREDGWQFVFLAANQDAVMAASQIAIGEEDAYGFDASAEGMQEASRTMSDAVRERRGRGRRGGGGNHGGGSRGET